VVSPTAKSVSVLVQKSNWSMTMTAVDEAAG
jgi:hypothetical protein